MEIHISSAWYVKPAEIRERISAGGVVVRVEDGQAWVALAREGDFPQYVLPKGGVKPGETLEQAARREILEEAGLANLRLIEYLGAFERLNFEQTRWMIIHFFLFLSPGLGGQPSDRKHPHPAAWFSVDALPQLLWPEQQRLLQQLAPRLKTLAA